MAGSPDFNDECQEALGNFIQSIGTFEFDSDTYRTIKTIQGVEDARITAYGIEKNVDLDQSGVYQYLKKN